MPSAFEIRLANHARKVRFAPSDPAKRFLSQLAPMREDEPLTPKQHLYVCSTTHRYRRQINAKIVADAQAELARYADGREPFELLLDAAPDDWDARLVYADFLGDSGDEIHAYAQRWMVEHQQCYVYRPSGHAWGNGTSWGINWQWYWWKETHYSVSHYCGTWHDTRAMAERELAYAIDELRHGREPKMRWDRRELAEA